jgi:hypothetical protein
VCVLSQEKSQICGLSSFVLPLRSSVIKPEDLRDILLLCDPKYLEKEWKYLYNLPKLHVVKVRVLSTANKRVTFQIGISKTVRNGPVPIQQTGPFLQKSSEEGHELNKPRSTGRVKVG